MQFVSLKKSWALAVAVAVLAGCGEDSTNTPNSSAVELKNQSVTPALIKKMPGFESMEVFSLLSSDDALAQSPSYVFGGSADGSGIMKSGDGFMMLVNNEDNFAVSRITFDKTFKPVKGEYVLNSDGGTWRLCSATLATPEVHGFGPMFLTCGESGEDSRVHGLDPLAAASSAAQSRELPALGRWSAENAVPLPKEAYTGKTVIIIGDDDSGASGGQVAMYIGNTGDLQNGSVYMLRRTDMNQKETDMAIGQKYTVEFVKIDNASTLTGKEINTKVDELKGIKFGRVEDVDYRKGGVGREVYFNVTGQAATGVNADNSRTKYGRVYRLTLNATDPTKGELELLLNGDDRAGVAGKFQNPDNICVTNNYVYIQEDANTYGDETHDAYIYQYNIASKELKVVTELAHQRGNTKYNVGGDSKFGSWEYGAMIDASDILGIPNTFVLCIQAHTWTGDRYKAADGGSKRTAENQASQLVVLKGLAR